MKNEYTHALEQLVGGQQVRYYELTNNKLVLKTTPIAFGDEEFIGVLTWERK